MDLIEWVLDQENIRKALAAVRSNKGAAGIDKMPVDALDGYFAGKEWSADRASIRAKCYKPQPVRRVYIPKPNGQMRPLGIPTVVDRVVQQAVAQVLSQGYERYFSENSYGFRPGRSCHQAVAKALEYVNDGYEWIIDLDIAKFFDTVNHDRLISILRERINDAPTLHLIRSFLKAGVMEEGLVSPTEEGTPQGGPLSPVISNVYLDKLDKELEARGLRYVRYADDCQIYVKSEMAANRVMKSVANWLERELRLKVSPTKTKVVRPGKSSFLGFTFWKSKGGWKLRPTNDRKKRLKDKTREILCRRKAAARPIGATFRKLNALIRGWVNYFAIGSMKRFMEQYGEWMRHKVRVIIVKQWKRPKTIYRNLQKLNRLGKFGFKHEDIFKVANTRLGLYRQCQGKIAGYLLGPSMLARATKERPGLVDPLEYYLSRCT